jgi:hypothetical protein
MVHIFDFSKSPTGLIQNYTVLLNQTAFGVEWYLYGTNTSPILGLTTATVTEVDHQSSINFVGGTVQDFDISTADPYEFYIMYLRSGLTSEGTRVEVAFNAVTGISYNPPNSTFTPVGETTGCSPTSISFTDTSGAPGGVPTAWWWNATNTTGNNTPFTFSTLQNPKWAFGLGNFSVQLNSSNAWGYNTSWQVTWINVSGFCPTGGGGITGVAMYGVDAPVDLGPLVLLVMAIVIISAVKKRRRGGEV